MKKNNFFLFLIVLFSSLNAYSQEELLTNFKPGKGNLPATLFAKATNSLTNVSQLNTNVNNLNVVVLNQVGLYNVADISQSKQTKQTVNQLGTKNYYSFIDFYNSSAINFSVLQQGNSNSLQIYGSNSLIDGMQISQKSNFKNIIIKNYK